jgi:hemolysin activation/secretion protein
LYALGDALDFYASYSNVDSGTVTAGVLDLAVSGKGAVYGGRYSQNLAKRGSYEARLSYGLDYKAFKNNVELLGQQLGSDVTVHPISFSYLGSWTPPGAELSGAVTVLHNVSGGANGSQADFSRARIGASATYNILRLAASLTKALPADWQLRAIVNGQYSSDALIPGEQFGAGGSTSVRGLRERELSNDSGVGTNIELYTPNLCAARAGWNCRALAFYDSAYLRRNRELAGELRSASVGSAGIGLRLLISSHVNLQIDYGHVVKAGATNVGDANRLHFRLGFSY